MPNAHEITDRSIRYQLDRNGQLPPPKGWGHPAASNFYRVFLDGRKFR